MFGRHPRCASACACGKYLRQSRAIDQGKHGNIAASNASSLTVTGSDGTSYTLPADGGALPVTPTTTTTYTATATGPGGTITASSTVTVAAATAPTVNLVASPMSISPGDSSTLTVTATHATSVTLTGSDGSSYSLAT